MSWVQSKKTRAAALILALGAVATAGAAAANVLVVRSSGPSAAAYPPGKALPDSHRLQLAAGDTVVLLGPAGTRTFQGPGSFSPSAPVQASAPATQVGAGGRRARIGAVRNAGAVPQSPTIWHVDATQSGRLCLADPANILLWRPDASETVRLAIAPAAGGAPAEVEWSAGQATLPWPQALAVADGAEYRVTWPGQPVPTRIAFRTLDSVPTDLPSVAAALIEKGCQEQLDLLVETAPPAP
jgi:hypothetical protein